MKKVIGIIVSLVVLMNITAYAESGKIYKTVSVAYPIIINGTKLNSDLPVLNLNGSTYLPLRKVSEAVNVNISWDETNREVLIQKNKNPNIDLCKSYALIMRAFSSTKAASAFNVLNDNIVLAKDNIVFENDLNEYNNMIIEYNKYVDRLKSVKQVCDNVKSLYPDCDYVNLNMSLDALYNALNCQSEAIAHLENYYKTNDKSYIDSMYSSLILATGDNSEAYKFSVAGESQYFNLINNLN